METVDYKKVGERIRILREDEGIGLKEIAAEFNLLTRVLSVLMRLDVGHYLPMWQSGTQINMVLLRIGY